MRKSIWIKDSEFVYRYFLDEYEGEHLAKDLMGDAVVEKGRWSHKIFDGFWYATVIPTSHVHAGEIRTQTFDNLEDAKVWVAEYKRKAGTA